MCVECHCHAVAMISSSCCAGSQPNVDRTSSLCEYSATGSPGPATDVDPRHLAAR